MRKVERSKQILDYHFNRLQEVVEFDNPEPQVIGEIGQGQLVLTISTGIHGDEIFPVRAVQELLPTLKKLNLRRTGKVRFIVCNPAAIKNRTRFIDADLNDVFPGDINGNFEQRQAQKILPLVSSSPFVVDLHTGIYAPPFAVLPTLDYRKLLLTEASGVDKIVVFENNNPGYGPMVDCTPCGIGVENGPHQDENSLSISRRVILNYLSSFGFIDQDPQPDKDQEYYRIIYHLPRQQGLNIAAQSTEIIFKEFSPMSRELFPNLNQTDSSIYPLLIDPERTYEDVYAYMAEKLTREELIAIINNERK